MKKIYLLALLGTFIVSCSSDDGSNNSSQTGSFIPTNEGNYWVYNVQGSVMSGRDSLYVAGDTVINNNSYKKLKTKEPVAYGFFSNALNNNGIRQANGKIYLSGTAGLNISEDLPFNLDVTDFIVFDENASNDQQLSIVEGSVNQEIEGYTLIFEYKMTSKAKAAIGSFTSGEEQYSNIKPVEITLNMGITVALNIGGFPFNFPLMAKQDVVVSTQYYAQGIGAVKSTTDISYNLSELPDIELPIPQSGSQHQEEILVDYNVE
jgi:hypothetical protein